MELFNTPIDSPILIGLTIVYFITSSITTFDRRLIQAEKAGTPSSVDHSMLPWWVGFILYIHWGIGLALLLLNWKYALVVFISKFVLSVLPVLETIGNILMAPFRPRQ